MFTCFKIFPFCVDICVYVFCAWFPNKIEFLDKRTHKNNGREKEGAGERESSVRMFQMKPKMKQTRVNATASYRSCLPLPTLPLVARPLPLSPIFCIINYYFALLPSPHNITFTIVALHHTSSTICVVVQFRSEIAICWGKGRFRKYLHSYTHTLSCFTSRYKISQCYYILFEIFFHIWML